MKQRSRKCKRLARARLGRQKERRTERLSNRASSRRWWNGVEVENFDAEFFGCILQIFAWPFTKAKCTKQALGGGFSLATVEGRSYQSKSVIEKIATPHFQLVILVAEV